MEATLYKEKIVLMWFQSHNPTCMNPLYYYRANMHCDMLIFTYITLKKTLTTCDMRVVRK
jgi:hypothetical protein